MNTAGLIVAVWAMAGALLIGWALFRLDKWAGRRMDEVDAWVELHEARRRHPATRTAGDRYVCQVCAEYTVGHPGEHICKRVGA